MDRMGGAEGRGGQDYFLAALSEWRPLAEAEERRRARRSAAFSCKSHHPDTPIGTREGLE